MTFFRPACSWCISSVTAMKNSVRIVALQALLMAVVISLAMDSING
jgi:hypothetical protein